LPESRPILAIDTCGPSGSVALGRLESGLVEILGQTDLAGRTYSATLVAAVAELLRQAGTQLGQLSAIVAINGPGSFTGVRVGLSAVKGLAEGNRTPVVAVSRLEVLASASGVPCAALDAHRHEIFLRLAEPSGAGRELLAGAAELESIAPPPRIAVCDEGAAQLLHSAWPATELVEFRAPTAADALMFAVPLVDAGEFVDLALLDGHYLRRSDAEIFGEKLPAEPQGA
jgi:tRNA threonylcarbamoyladenosine biosynthesis protein TsaB